MFRNAVFGTWMLARKAVLRSCALLFSARIVSFSSRTIDGGGRPNATISLVIRFVPSLRAWTKALPSGSFINLSHSSSFLFWGIESSMVVLRSKWSGKSTFCCRMRPGFFTTKASV